MEPVRLPLLQLDDGIPLPEAPEHVHVLTGAGRDHREPSLFPDLGHLDVGLDLALVIARRYALGLEWRVLAALPVPERHHGEEQEAPSQRDREPELLGPVDLLPPHTLERMDAHGGPPTWAARREAPAECWRSR